MKLAFCTHSRTMHPPLPYKKDSKSVLISDDWQNQLKFLIKIPTIFFKISLDFFTFYCGEVSRRHFLPKI